MKENWGLIVVCFQQDVRELRAVNAQIAPFRSTTGVFTLKDSRYVHPRNYSIFSISLLLL